MTDESDGWRQEQESAWLYRRLAEAESDPTKRELFVALAKTAESQALLWQSTSPGEVFQPSARARLLALLVKMLGVKPVRPMLVAMKLRGLSVYGATATTDHPLPTDVAQVGARHRNVSAGNLRAAVFGINDGLVSNAALVLGVVAAGAEPKTVLITGVAGLLAGGLSMAAGEYVSVRSQREMYQRQISLERAELALYPEAEAEELALIYQARGLELDRARSFARELLKQPEHALNVLAREELGVNPDDLGSPFAAASASFIAFGCGALIPLSPFALDLSPSQIVAAVLALSATALAAVGAAISLFTGHRAWRGALRMVAIGGGAGLIAWSVGRIMGVTLG